MISSVEKCSLAWEDFQANTSKTFCSLKTDRDFSDVTLVCEDNKQFEAHKVILATSSPLLGKMLRTSKHTNPLLYFWGVKARDLSSVVDFVYDGQVQLYESDLADFLTVAKVLGIKGLNMDEIKEEKETKLTSQDHYEPQIVQTHTADKHRSKVEQNKSFNVSDLSLFDPEVNCKMEESSSRIESLTHISSENEPTKEKTDPISKMFTENCEDPAMVYCKMCAKLIDRGQVSKLFKQIMRSHIKTVHREEFWKLQKSKKRSPIWEMYKLDVNDTTKAFCKECDMQISLGRTVGKTGNGGLISHLKTNHIDRWQKVIDARNNTKIEEVKSNSKIKNQTLEDTKKNIKKINVSDYFDITEDLAECQVKSINIQ